MANSTKENQDFNRMINLKTVSTYKKIAGIIWCAGALFILEFLLNDEAFAFESRIFWYYYIWTIPFFYVFQDSEYVYETFNDRQWIWIVPYIINTCFIVLTLFARESLLETDFGFPPLVRECCGTLFWILSIPLTIIKKDCVWTVYAILVYVNSVVYYYVLMGLNDFTRENPGYIIINVVIILFAYVVSMCISFTSFKRTIKFGIQ